MVWEYVSIPGAVISILIFGFITKLNSKYLEDTNFYTNDSNKFKLWMLFLQIYSPITWPLWALGFFALDFLGFAEPKYEYSFLMALDYLLICSIASFLGVLINFAIRFYPGILIGLSFYEWFLNDLEFSPIKYLRDPIEWLIQTWSISVPEIFGWQVELLLTTQISLILLHKLTANFNSID